jgi:hypothetical protein
MKENSWEGKVWHNELDSASSGCSTLADVVSQFLAHLPLIRGAPGLNLDPEISYTDLGILLFSLVAPGKFRSSTSN